MLLFLFACVYIDVSRSISLQIQLVNIYSINLISCIHIGCRSELWCSLCQIWVFTAVLCDISNSGFDKRPQQNGSASLNIKNSNI